LAKAAAVSAANELRAPGWRAEATMDVHQRVSAGLPVIRSEWLTDDVPTILRTN
jgi:membrane-bound lytic murein transglycosylase B